MIDYSFDSVLWDKLLSHCGHNVRIAKYGDPKDPVDVCLECEDCGEVILDAEIYTLMKNWKMYEEEIRKIRWFIATSRNVNKTGRCTDIGCKNCLFLRDGNCCAPSERIDWLCQEYIEKPRLTKRERMFCKFVETGWIARDEDETLWWFNNKPKKIATSCWLDGDIYRANEIGFGLSFDFIKWEDEEPWSVEDLLKLEVQDDKQG